MLKLTIHILQAEKANVCSSSLSNLYSCILKYGVEWRVKSSLIPIKAPNCPTVSYGHHVHGTNYTAVPTRGSAKDIYFPLQIGWILQTIHRIAL